MNDATNQDMRRCKRAAQKGRMKIHSLELRELKPAELESLVTFRAFV